MSDATKSAPEPEGGFRLLPLELIDDPQRPLRSDLTEESLAELVLSIKQMGIIEPIIVRPQGNRFEVIAGHRRLSAAALAGLATLPCIIKNIGNEETEIMKLHENMYRLDVEPVDEAQHFDYLIQKLNISPGRIAQLIGKSQSYVSDRLAILSYPPELKNALKEHKITFSVARTFSRHPDPEKVRTFLKYAIQNGMTPTMAEKWVKEDLAQNEERTQITTTTVNDGLNGPIEQPTYHCYLCTNPMTIIEMKPVNIHDRCDRAFQEAANKADTQ